MKTNPYEVLNSIANGENKYHVSELLFASSKLDGLIEDELIISLKNHLESLSGSEGATSAMALANIFQKASSEDVRIECLAIIISNNKIYSGTGPVQINKWRTKAKETAIKHLSIYKNSTKAQDAISKGLHDFFVSSSAARALVQTDYGTSLVLQYIRTNPSLLEFTINAIRDIDTPNIVEELLWLLDSNPKIAELLAQHINPEVKDKAVCILNAEKEKENEKRQQILSNQDNQIEREYVIPNFQLEVDLKQESHSRRKKSKFPRRIIKENTMSAEAYFKCPFCHEQNVVNQYYCDHVVYGYETVNYEILYKDENFFRILITCLSANPYQCIDDLKYLLDEYADEHFSNDNRIVKISINDLKIILDKTISPDVIDKIFSVNGIPKSIRSITEYSSVNYYIGGGTYIYVLSDDDLERTRISSD